MNILLSSVGRRVSVVQYLKAELQGKGQIIAVDASPYAPALLFADIYEIAPPIYHPDYIPFLLEMCQKCQVKAILSFIDPELSILAAHREEFKKIGVELVVSDYEVTEICFDKKATYEFLRNQGLPCIPTYTTLPEIEAACGDGSLQFPLLAKPRRGSASIGVELIPNERRLQEIMDRGEEVVIQPYLTGPEIGIDAYADLLNGQLVSIFIKEKIIRNAGVTNTTISVIDERISNLIERLVFALRPKGPIDIDCFLVGDECVISEINPRFGGTYPHAYQCGVNFFPLLLNNLRGVVNSRKAESYRPGTVLMNYDQLVSSNTLSVVK